MSPLVPKRSPGLAVAGIVLAATVLHTQAARRSMGVTLEGRGSRIFITHVDPGGPAEKAGLEPGDEINTIAGITVDRLDPAVLRVIVDTAKVMKFVIWRNDKRLSFNVQPGMYAPPPKKPPVYMPPPGTRVTMGAR